MGRENARMLPNSLSIYSIISFYFTTISLIEDIVTAHIKHFLLMTQNLATFTKQVCVTDYCTMLYTVFYIPSSIGSLFLTPIRAEKAKERIMRSIDFEYLQEKSPEITHKLHGC